MKKLITLCAYIVLVAVAGCAVTDSNGKKIGACVGAGCFLRAAFGANVVPAAPVSAVPASDTVANSGKAE